MYDCVLYTLQHLQVAFSNFMFHPLPRLVVKHGGHVFQRYAGNYSRRKLRVVKWLVFPGSGIQENLADKAKRLGIPVWRFGTGGA